jgi:translation initiation factor IF-3
MIKEVKYHFEYTEEDYQIKLKQIVSLLKEGSQVKAIMMFRNKELAHKEVGEDLFRKLEAQLTDHMAFQLPPVMDGKHMFVLFTPEMLNSVWYLK